MRPTYVCVAACSPRRAKRPRVPYTFPSGRRYKRYWASVLGSFSGQIHAHGGRCRGSAGGHRARGAADRTGKLAGARRAPREATQPVALHGVTVPDRSGDGLECRSTSQFASNEQQWDCGETRVTAKYGQTTDDPSLALARFVRYRLLEREPDTSVIEDLGGDARVARVDRPEGTLVAVVVPRGNGSVYVEFAKGDAEAAAQPLIDAVRGGEFDDEQ